MAIFAEVALLPGGWAGAVRVELAGGRVDTVAAGAVASPGDVRVTALVPGMANLHSHAFQRGFAGLTEYRGAGRDSFWTWREAMYRFALALSPEAMQAIAALAYVEMLEAGFTRVGEFHYLHHAPDGRAYDDPAEMSARILAAATETGIALTHLPVFYAYSGFGGRPAGEEQRRFLHDADGFARLISACEALPLRPQDRLGVAPHSLRAAGPGDLARLAGGYPGRPFHIHVAEQVAEVEDCLGHTGARPVGWLLDHCDVGPDWCLVHATHMEAAEVAGLAATGAVAGLCPLTEADLGDGLFPAVAYRGAGGRFGIGTDSNLAIGLAGELRLLEYGQRLEHRERNLLAEGGSTGEALFRAALAGGAQALGAGPAEIAPGAAADLVGLADAMGLAGGAERLLDRWVFGRDVKVEAVWAAGVQVVRGGRHGARERVEAAARGAILELAG